MADLIAIQSDAAARAALHAVRGGYSQTLKNLRERLVSFSALIELELDFSQEEVEFADRTQLYHLIDEATETTAALLQSFRLGNVIKNGVSVAIVGKPNAGKSTLLNVLLNEERAIVSEIAGTTRDTIEEVLNIDGILFRLIDTAGIRHHTSDVIEQIGVGRSLEKMEAADIVVYLFGVRDEARVMAGGREYDAVAGQIEVGTAPQRREDSATLREDLVKVREDLVQRGKSFLLVGNKVDLAVADGGTAPFPEELWISARQGNGVDILRRRLVDLVLQGESAGEGTIVTNARHFQALEKVGEALASIRKGLDELLPGDLLALDIRVALHYLGEITGEITTEEMLGWIFGKFCVGK